MSDEVEKKSRTKSAICYIVGSAFFCAATIALIPKVSTIVSGSLNKAMNTYSNAQKDNDDWGAEIVSKDYGEERV